MLYLWEHYRTPSILVLAAVVLFIAYAVGYDTGYRDGTRDSRSGES